MRLHGFLWDRLGRTLTGKFLFLLAGFLILQTLQLGIGTYGILQLGERVGLINDAGRQRMNTLLLLEDARAAASAKAWTATARGDFLRRIEEQDRMLEILAREAFRGRTESPDLARVRTHWDKILKPRLQKIVIDPAPQDVAALPAEVRVHLTHLDALVELVERRARADALALALFHGAILIFTLLLGLVGLGMARYVVTRPMRRLIEAARRIAAGDYARRIPVSSRDEVGELAQTFNEMAEAVAHKTAGIQALNEVALGLSASLGLDNVIAMILDEAKQIGDIRGVALALDEPAVFDEHHRRGLTAPQAERLQHLAEIARREDRRVEKTMDGETYLCLPLASRGNQQGLQGVLCFLLPASSAARDDGLYHTFAALAAEAIANARTHARALDEAATDPLTGLANRRALELRLRQEFRRAQRSGQPLSVLILDVDHFKYVNDRYGHAAGDAVLVRLAEIVKGQLRGFDLVARYGGEEFVVLLPGIGGTSARTVAERIRHAVAGTALVLPDGRELGVTISIGLACYPDCASGTEEMLQRADQALYAAKAAGRNCVVLYSDMFKSELERDPDRVVKLLNESPVNIEALVSAVSAKAPFYHTHNDLVVDACGLLAQALGLSDEERERLRLVALLHDVGMLTVPDAVLNKTTALSAEEWALLREHPATAARWLEQVPALASLAPIVRHHHERYAGGGYPDGLQGEAIPYLARVLAVADAYAALIADWPGHQGASRDRAIAELKAAAGSQLDPGIAEVFLKTLEEEATKN